MACFGTPFLGGPWPGPRPSYGALFKKPLYLGVLLEGPEGHPQGTPREGSKKAPQNRPKTPNRAKICQNLQKFAKFHKIHTFWTGFLAPWRVLGQTLDPPRGHFSKNPSNWDRYSTGSFGWPQAPNRVLRDLFRTLKNMKIFNFWAGFLAPWRVPGQAPDPPRRHFSKNPSNWGWFWRVPDTSWGPPEGSLQEASKKAPQKQAKIAKKR